MIVIDLDKNKKKYKVGDLIEFKLDYMGVIRIMNSKYIRKKDKKRKLTASQKQYLSLTLSHMLLQLL